MDHHFSFVLVVITLFLQCTSVQTDFFPQCTSSNTNIKDLSSIDEWIRWGMFYSYCFQINGLDTSCTSAACKSCIYPCKMPLNSFDLSATCDSNCINEFNTTQEQDYCKNGCGYYRFLLNKTDAPAFTLNTTKLPIDMTAVNTVEKNFDNNKYSWSNADNSNVPSVYLVVLFYKNSFRTISSILGLTARLDYTLDSTTICNNKGLGINNYDVEMELQLLVQPINLNGKADKNTTSTFEAMKKLPAPTNVQFGSPSYSKPSNVPLLVYTVTWENPKNSSEFYTFVRDTRIFYTNGLSCTDTKNFNIMLKYFLSSDNSESVNKTNTQFNIVNTDNDNFKTCQVKVRVIPKVGSCLVGQHSTATVTYNGCKEVSNYPAGTCEVPTTPKPTDEKTRNFTIKAFNWRCASEASTFCFNNGTFNDCGTCFKLEVLNSTVSKCYTCESTLKDIQLSWLPPTRTATPIQFYILRYGIQSTLFPSSVGFGTPSTEVNVPNNQTSYLVYNYTHSGTFGFTAYPQTSTPGEQFSKVSYPYGFEELKLPTDEPITNYRLTQSNWRCVEKYYEICFRNQTVNECGECYSYENLNLTHYNCSECVKTLVDLRFSWDAPERTGTPIQHYILRYGPEISAFPPQLQGTEVIVPNNQTFFKLQNYEQSGDFGFTVHAQTSTPGAVFLRSSAKHSFSSLELTTNVPPPATTTPKPKPPIEAMQPDDGNDTGAIVAAVAVSVICIVIFLILFIFWRRRSFSNKNKAQWSNDDYYWQSRNIVTDEWEIHPETITLDEKIGEGAFGTVFSATIEAKVLMKTKYSQLRGGGGFLLSNKNGFVAVKFLKDGAGTEEIEDFREEIHLMKSIGYHKNIVNLIACSTIEKPLCLIVEYLPHGDLLHYLRKRRSKLIATTADGEQSHAQGFMYTKDYQDSLQTTTSTVNSQSNLVPDIQVGPDAQEDEVLTADDLISFAWQIASGMEYLAANNMVHRDLAARNVLVGDDKVVKISDFGLTRRMSTDMIYMSRKSRRLPIKWMSVEAIFSEKFTSASDVWAYGIVLFEIVTLGGTPYPSIANKELLRMLKEGYRMEKPDNCAEAMYDIMLHCWNEDADQRPNFTELREHLENIMSAGDKYLSFDINADNSYYNVASFKSAQSEDEDEDIFNEVMKNRNEMQENLKQSEEQSKEDAEEDRKLEEKIRKLDDPVEDDSNDIRYFSPSSIKKGSELDPSDKSNGKMNEYTETPKLAMNGKTTPIIDDISTYVNKNDTNFTAIL